MQSSHGRQQHIFGPLRLSRPPAYKWVRESILRKSCFLSDIALGGGRPGNSLGTTVTLLGTPFGFSRECIIGAIAGYIYRISYGDIQMWIFFPFHMHKNHVNRNNICPMLIYNHSSQAPMSLDHLYKVISLHEMSPHQIAKQNMTNLNSILPKITVIRMCGLSKIV